MASLVLGLRSSASSGITARSKGYFYWLGTNIDENMQFIAVLKCFPSLFLNSSSSALPCTELLSSLQHYCQGFFL